MLNLRIPGDCMICAYLRSAVLTFHERAVS